MKFPYSLLIEVCKKPRNIVSSHAAVSTKRRNSNAPIFNGEFKFQPGVEIGLPKVDCVIKRMRKYKINPMKPIPIALKPDVV